VKPEILPRNLVSSSTSSPTLPLAKVMVLDITPPPLATWSVPPAIVAPEIAPPDSTSSKPPLSI
jgi:hypothetical protein